MTLTKAPRVAQKKFSEFKNFYYIRRQKTDDLGPRFKKSPTEFPQFNFWVRHRKPLFISDIFGTSWEMSVYIDGLAGIDRQSWPIFGCLDLLSKKARKWEK